MLSVPFRAKRPSLLISRCCPALHCIVPARHVGEMRERRNLFTTSCFPPSVLVLFSQSSDTIILLTSEGACPDAGSGLLCCTGAPGGGRTWTAECFWSVAVPLDVHCQLSPNAGQDRIHSSDSEARRLRVWASPGSRLTRLLGTRFHYLHTGGLFFWGRSARWQEQLPPTAISMQSGDQEPMFAGYIAHKSRRGRG